MNINTRNLGFVNFNSEEMQWIKFNNVIVYEAWKKLIASGIPPITLQKCKNTNLIDYKIYGNSVQGSKLPSEYQQVEYIESTGTQYIDTGIVTNSNLSISTTLLFNEVGTDVNSGVCPYGAYDANNSSIYWRCSEPYSVSRVGYGSKQIVSPQIGSITGNKIVLGNNKEEFYFIGVDNKKWEVSFEQQSFSGTKNIYIFAQNGTTTSRYSKMRLYGFTISNDTNELRNFIPCYRKSDNVIGLYDLIENKFYTNAGTGTFLKGNVIGGVPTPDASIEIESVGEYDETTGKYKIPIKVRGKNYCTNHWEIGYIRQGDGKIEATAGYIRTDFMELPYGKTYRVSVLTDYGTHIGVHCYDKDLNYIGFKSTNKGSNFTPLENTTYVRLRLATTDINQQIQIEDGTVTTTYEDYKEPIMFGKNLLNPIFPSDLWGGSGSGALITTSAGSHSQIVKVKPNTNYFISCDNLDLMNDKTLRVWEMNEYPALGVTTGIRRNMGNQGGAFELNFTTSEDTNYLLLSSGGTSTTVYDFTSCKIQVEENTVKTSYESYEDSTRLKIYLKEPLRKVGNYTDYINFETKKVYRNIAETVLDGSGSYINADNSLTKTYRVSKSFSDSRGINPVLCDKLKPINQGTSSDDTENIQFSGTSVYIRIKRERLNSEDVNGVKEYLASNPITFCYILSASSVKEENVELPNIPTYKGTNIIEFDTVTPSNMELKYYGKGKNQLLSNEENITLNSILADDTDTEKDMYDSEIIEKLDEIIGG